MLAEFEADFPGSWVDRASAEEIRQSVEASIAETVPTAVSSESAQTSIDIVESRGDVTLNFEEADLREFIQVTALGTTWARVNRRTRWTGQVTMHTTYPIVKEAVLPLLESVLQQNGAALVRGQGIYKIVPLARAEGEAGSPSVGSQLARPGYSVQIVPVRHIAATEMEKILKPFLPQGSALRVDTARNLLILSGPQYRLDEMI